jgi:hypothetical protein
MANIPMILGTTDIAGWLTRVVSREYEVKDPGRDTIIILLRLNLAIDELTRTVERLATTIRSVPGGREGLQ